MPAVVSTSIAAFTTAALVEAGTVAAGSFAANAVFAGISVGGEFLILKMLSEVYNENKDDDPDTEQPPPLGTARDINQSVPAMQFCLGEVTVPCQHQIVSRTSVFGTHVDNRIEEENPGPYWVRTYGIACHRTELIRSFVGGIPVQSVPHGNGFSESPSFRDTSGEYFLAESYRNGMEDQPVDPIILRNFPNIDPNFKQAWHSMWTGEFYRGQNRDEYQEIWGELRNLSVEVRIWGLFCFDPTDQEQDPDDPSTWKRTKNAAVILGNLLANRLVFKRPLSFDDLDLRAWKRSIEVSRIAYPRLDGTFGMQYPISGIFNANERPGDVIDHIRLACHAEILFKNGKYHIEVGEPKSPVMTIHDGMVLGAQAYSASPRIEDRVDALAVRCKVPEANFQVAALPVISYLQPGERSFTNPNSLELRMLEGSSEGQRIGWTHFRRSGLTRTLTLQMGDEAVLLDAGDVVKRVSDLLPATNGNYEVNLIRPSEQVVGTFEVEVTEYDPLIYDWNPQEMERPFELGTIRLN